MNRWIKNWCTFCWGQGRSLLLLWPHSAPFLWMLRPFFCWRNSPHTKHHLPLKITNLLQKEILFLIQNGPSSSHSWCHGALSRPEILFLRVAIRTCIPYLHPWPHNLLTVGSSLTSPSFFNLLWDPSTFWRGVGIPELLVDYWWNQSLVRKYYEEDTNTLSGCVSVYLLICSLDPWAAHYACSVTLLWLCRHLAGQLTRLCNLGLWSGSPAHTLVWVALTRAMEFPTFYHHTAMQPPSSHLSLQHSVRQVRKDRVSLLVAALQSSMAFHCLPTGFTALLDFELCVSSQVLWEAFVKEDREPGLLKCQKHLSE